MLQLLRTTKLFSNTGFFEHRTYDYVQEGLTRATDKNGKQRIRRASNACYQRQNGDHENWLRIYLGLQLKQMMF